jgi:hypothetical protein
MNAVINPELLEARQAADALGIKYHHRANAATINNLISEHSLDQGDGPKPAPGHQIPTMGPGAIMSKEEFQAQQTKKRIRNAGALKRIRVTCMNPQKRNWKGEVISVGSRKMGTFKKFIPFDGQPYHVPQVIYEELKSRQCTVFITEKRGGEDFRVGKLVNEFAIDDLPPLTQEELADLEKKQALAASGL